MKLFQLVPDARQWWRWHSTHIYAVLAIFPQVWLSSDDLQRYLPAHVVLTVGTAIAVLGFILRLRDQSGKTK